MLEKLTHWKKPTHDNSLVIKYFKRLSIFRIFSKYIIYLKKPTSQKKKKLQKSQLPTKNYKCLITVSIGENIASINSGKIFKNLSGPQLSNLNNV